MGRRVTSVLRKPAASKHVRKKQKTNPQMMEMPEGSQAEASVAGAATSESDVGEQPDAVEQIPRDLMPQAAPDWAMIEEALDKVKFPAQARRNNCKLDPQQEMTRAATLLQ